MATGHAALHPRPVYINVYVFLVLRWIGIFLDFCGGRGQEKKSHPTASFTSKVSFFFISSGHTAFQVVIVAIVKVSSVSVSPAGRRVVAIGGGGSIIGVIFRSARRALSSVPAVLPIQLIAALIMIDRRGRGTGSSGRRDGGGGGGFADAGDVVVVVRGR